MRFRIAVSTALFIGSVATASAQDFVRESLSTFLQDQDKLRSLLIGVQTMKSRDTAPRDSAEYRKSWEYWSAIHGYTGPSPSITVAQLRQLVENQAPELAPFYASFYEGLTDKTPPDELAEEVWATCRHGNPPVGDIHFLTWHRMYLYFFERVLREASGDPNFALPYWDYTELGTSTDQPWRMPIWFVPPTLGPAGQSFPNPLFEPRRTPGFGIGVQLDVERTNVDASLALDEFLEFSAGIETGVHGYVHCAVGNACLAPMIGIVPLAGDDPIFWKHHANIDRLMSCWIEHHGSEKLPTDQAWLERSFPFVDENGDRVEMQVAELFDPGGRIDYVYDDLSAAGCFREPPMIPVASISDDSGAEPTYDIDLTVARNVVFSSMATSLPLVPESERVNLDPSSVASDRVILTLRDIGVKDQPGSLLAFDLVSDSSGERRQIGVLSFFALDDSSHAHHGVEPASDGLSFDVTNALSELDATGLDKVSLEIRAINLLVPTDVLRTAASDFAEMSPQMDAAEVLHLLEKTTADQLVDFLDAATSGFDEESLSAGVEPSAEDTAASLERMRSAKITIGEINLSIDP